MAKENGSFAGAAHMASRDDNFGVSLFGWVAVLPSVGFVFLGLLAIFWQFFEWLDKAGWPELNLRIALRWLTGRAIYDRDLASGYFGLDTIVLWFVDRVPLALWLIVIVPLVWIVTWIVIFNFFIGDKRSNARRSD
jgi:hypothetical protein